MIGSLGSILRKRILSPSCYKMILSPYWIEQEWREMSGWVVGPLKNICENYQLFSRADHCSNYEYDLIHSLNPRSFFCDCYEFFVINDFPVVF